MNLQILERFLFWSLVVNVGIYTLTAITVVALRGFVYKVHQTLFGLDDDAVAALIVRYLGNFKLLITIFNFVPWIAVLIIK